MVLTAIRLYRSATRENPATKVPSRRQAKTCSNVHNQLLAVQIVFGSTFSEDAGDSNLQTQ